MAYKCQCGKDFKHYYLLTRHQEGKKGCSYIQSIRREKEFENKAIEPIEKEKNHKCHKCNKEISNKYNLERHLLTCDKNTAEINNMMCVKFIEQINTNPNNEIIKLLIVSLITKLTEIENKPIIKQPIYKYLSNLYTKLYTSNTPLSVDQAPIIKQTGIPAPIPIIDIDVANSEINESDINSHNTTNTNCNNTNCNNTTTINYSPIIYPFGFENLNFLSQNERVELISSPNCLIDVLNKVYTHSENRNYHKRNMNRDQVTVIMENYDIKVFSDREYQDMMVKQLIKIVYILFYKSKNGLTFDKQATLWEKIKLMETMALECVDKDDQKQPKKFRKLIDNISGILATTNENINASNEFSEFKTKMNDTMYKDHLITLVGEITREFENYKKDLADVSITDEELRAFWTEPDEDISIESPQNNIERNELEDIYRYKYFKKMIEIENTKLNESIQSVGNINEVYNIRLKRAEEELELLKEHYKLSKIGMFPIRRFLLIDSLSESISKSQEIYNDILKLKQQEEKEAIETIRKSKTNHL